MKIKITDNQKEDSTYDSDEDLNKKIKSMEDRAAFDDAVDSNWSPDEQSDLDAEARGNQPSGGAAGSETRPAAPASNSVYDSNDSQPVTRPDLHAQRGGPEGSSSGSAPSLTEKSEPGIGKAKSLDSPELNDKEKAAESGAQSLIGKGEHGLIGKGLNTADKFLPPQARIASVARKVFTKKKAAGGGIAGVIAGILILGFTIGAGPLKLVHLSQILQHGSEGSEDNSATGVRGLFRYYRTNDIGETRVSKLGSEVFKKTTAKLEAIGFDFSDRNALTGHIKSITVDTSKHPAFKGLRPGERQAALIKHFDIKDPSIVSQHSQNSFKINLDGTSVKGISFSNSAVNTAVGDLQDGKIAVAMNKRVLKKFFNLPKLFSPISKREKAATNNLAERTLTKREKRALEKERGEERFKKFKASPAGIKAAAAKDKLKSSLESHRVALTGGLTITAAACLVREVRGIGPAVDRAEIIDASVMEEEDKKAVGAKVQSGHDLDARDPGIVAEGLIDDNGQDVFGGKAMQVLARKTKPNGTDIQDKHRQAFSLQESADLEDIANSVGSVVCSNASLIAQGVLSVALVFTGPGGWAVNAAKTIAGGAATAAVIATLINRYTDSLEDKAQLDLPLRGHEGGNLLAYASRESDNIGCRAMGCTALSDTESQILDQHAMIQDQNEFRAKSFASRLFDVNDYRSLAGNFIDNSTIDPGQNITSIASSLGNINLFGSGLFSTFSSRASAAEKPYDWGFPHYGISKKLLESPKYEDPYDNAEKAAALFDADDKYIDKAKKCFGVKITKDSGKWLAQTEDEVNPKDDEYRGADCNEDSENWNRVILFVFYDRLITITACYDGDEGSCKELGFATDASDTSTPATTDAVDEATSGSVQELLDTKNVSIYPGGQSDLKANHINPKVVNLMLALSKKHEHLSITTMITGHNYLTASGNVSDHGFGGAIDIGEVDGETCNAHVKPRSKCFALANEVAGLSGELKPSQVIWYVLPTPSPPGLALSDHDDHVHVGYHPAASGPGSKNYLAP